MRIKNKVVSQFYSCLDSRRFYDKKGLTTGNGTLQALLQWRWPRYHWQQQCTLHIAQMAAVYGNPMLDLKADGGESPKAEVPNTTLVAAGQGKLQDRNSITNSPASLAIAA